MTDYPQSALEPAGAGAAQIAALFYWMVAGAVIIWLVVIGLAVYALIFPRDHAPKVTRRVVIIGGAVFPTVVLTGLLSYTLAMLPELHRPAPANSLTVHVDGVMWWWRVTYQLADNSQTVETANEIRLPVNEEVEFKLQSEDVIHSFWIPSIGGKMDMIPGRITRLKLHPTKTGRFRGACAEFCGDSHAWMNFDVIVMERQDFDEWLARQQSEASPPSEPIAQRGHDLFMQRGCGACHAIRGTAADGVVGPDLTHFGTRSSIGAGMFENEHDSVAQWISHSQEIKPGVHMPSFHGLDDAALDAITTYLRQLQ